MPAFVAVVAAMFIKELTQPPVIELPTKALIALSPASNASMPASLLADGEPDKILLDCWKSWLSRSNAALNKSNFALL